jgi:hypothetical protein
MKDSDPRKVIEGNVRFAAARPDVPLHLGVTEAGMLPDGVVKTRIAFEQLLSRGIGDTLRVSLTLPFADKWKEVEAGLQIIADVEAGRYRSVPVFQDHGLNIISCPSCSRVENEAFVDLAFKVKEMSVYAKAYDITIAIMGCRVNGPGETDDADLGLWCAPNCEPQEGHRGSWRLPVRRRAGPVEGGTGRDHRDEETGRGLSPECLRRASAHGRQREDECAALHRSSRVLPHPPLAGCGRPMPQNP